MPERSVALIPVYCRECSRVAFYTSHRWGNGEGMKSNQARHVDGRPFHERDPIACDACGIVSYGPEVSLFSFDPIA